MSTILKCKMCGGDIEATTDMTVGKCKYCGSTMTLPRIASDRKARLFNRANEYRLNNEFDKAYDAYKAIVEEDEQESEAYWGMILSEYGIEYVEDPATHKRIPTCHRTHVQSICDSVNYKSAIEYADAERRLMYQDESEELDKLQRRILSVSSKEEPFDVFISYKETNEAGERTEDSAIAYEIYNALEKEGLRVFFSRVTLENHLGEDYEPYIYAALSSARVMLLVTTNEENCESVWVKNEWQRYLKMMEDNENKSIIPVYKGITAYELPRELSKYQSLDYEKVGALQDLTHGVQKILGTTQRETQNKKLDELAAAFSQKEEADKKHKRKTKKIMVAVVCSILAIALIIGGFNIYKVQEAESKLREAASPYVGAWKSSDETHDFIINIDGTCSIDGESLVWSRDSITNGSSPLYSSTHEALGYFSALYNADGSCRCLRVQFQSKSSLPKALISLTESTLFGKQ